jgi:FAD/FMN-containing dehydrogenase
VKLSSWGNLSNDDHNVVDVYERSAIAPALASAATSALAYGMGRSYGDVCLNPAGRILRTRGLSRFLEFDETQGLLTVEAGVTLAEISDVFIPRGWRLAVVPGTEQVTVGGAIANDVHGKSHHLHGAFSRQVERIWLQRTDQPLLEVTRELTPELFEATIGGIGLTGIITAATLRLIASPSPWIDAETIPFHGLAEFESLSDESVAWENSVAWIDCLSGRDVRGLFTRGNPTAADGGPSAGRRLAVPVVPPISAVNPVSLRLFNAAYYEAGKRSAGRTVQHYKEFFFPLDRISDWNRIYGPRGFFQYQSVIPPQSATAATQEMLDAIRDSGQGSFLAVLKRFGSIPSEGMLSFPTEGTTLALDFPNLGAKTETLFAKLDAIVLAAGGRLYLAKDARMPRAMFEAGYPQAQEFMQWRDPGMASAMSARLFGK